MNILLQNSLFSTILSLYVILLLYFPPLILQFIFSPVIFSTFILLLYLLRLGASQKFTIQQIESDSPESNSVQSLPKQVIEEEFVDDDRGSDLGICRFESDPKQKLRQFYADSFLEWNIRAPLEVIYEEYEGEDAEEEKDSEAKRESQMNIIQRYASLSLFYPESDSDASSEEGDYRKDGDWDSPEDICFRWEEDDREGLIEIALDEKRNCEEEVDEDNLIEIDLSPTTRR